MNKEKIKNLLSNFFGMLLFAVMVAGIIQLNVHYEKNRNIKQPSLVYIDESNSNEAPINESKEDSVPAAAIINNGPTEIKTQPTKVELESSSQDYFESNDGVYDFGYNTNPDEVWYNQMYLTADAEIMKRDGYEGCDVNFSGDIDFASKGSIASDQNWFDARTMADLDAYYITDSFGYGNYIVLTAYQSRVFTGDNVTVYGTVIGIDKNGTVYVAGQMVELAPAG